MVQKYTSPTRTGLIFALEPVFAAFFGYWFVHEKLSLQGYAGAALVLLGIVASELLGKLHLVPPARMLKKRRANL
ncbi:EamA-like transporter family protein [compost metagenome]